MRETFLLLRWLSENFIIYKEIEFKASLEKNLSDYEFLVNIIFFFFFLSFWIELVESNQKR